MLLLLGLLACETDVARIPGDLPRTGETLETVNGKPVTRSMLDAHLRAMPEEVRAQVEEQGQVDQLQEQVVVQEMLVQEALAQDLHDDEDVKLMLLIAEREALVEALLRKVAAERTTDEALQAYYDEHKVQYRKDEVKLSQIVTNDLETAEAAVAAAGVEGAAFSAVAGEYSIDPRAKENGGEVGWVSKREMPPQLQAALTEAKAGDIVGPIEVPGAVLVLFIEDARELVPFEDVRDELEPQVQQAEVRAYVEELRDTTIAPQATLGAPELPAAPEGG
ncbi:MAG TPA: peptidyl-prolyl cis-trans isomerase [Myxococcota bacterium]|nr:peptidyl-prolyl cis-trans isomerase [Myxococcota bacterium]